MLTLFIKTSSIAFFSLLIFGCAGVEHVIDRPKISVARVTPMNFGLKSQTFRFALNIFNPNAFALPVKKIQATALFSGIEVGQGLTKESVNLTANANTKMNLDITTDISKVINNIGDLFKTKNLNLDYELAGKILLVDSGVANGFSVPFNVTGNLLK